jgi:hypothetical protein
LRFVTLLGRDTIGVEEARLDGRSLRGVILVQEPATTRFEYRLERSPRGGLVSASITEFALDSVGWRPRRTVSLRAIGDSVHISSDSDAAACTVYAPEALLSLPSSGALLWVAAQRFDALQVDSAALPWLAPLGGPGGRFIVRRVAPSVLEYRLSGGFSVLRRNEAGSITSVDARATTLKIEMAPADAGVMVEVQERWSQMRGGTLSPRDTARARIAGAQIMVDYGKPAVRGRDVFARGVLGDSVWRTGANAATQLHTSAALEFANGAIPAGVYSLFTRISDDGVELLINSRAGIWGTQYSAASDLLSVPMRRERAPFAERLRISVDSLGPALVIHWADQAFSVPFRVASPPR